MRNIAIELDGPIAVLTLNRPQRRNALSLEMMGEIIEKHEDAITDQTAKMLGQDDPFSRAMIESQLKNIDQKFDDLMKTGLPEEVRAYMGMMGFRIRINVHGEVVEVEQPGMIAPDDEE